MITVILLALIGNQVFPGHEFWWAAYVVLAAVVNSIRLLVSVLKLIME